MSPEPISCTCPKCGRTYRVRPNLDGKRIVCKECKNEFVVKAADLAATQEQESDSSAAPVESASSGSDVDVTVAQKTKPAADATASQSDEDAPIPLDDAPASQAKSESAADSSSADTSSDATAPDSLEDAPIPIDDAPIPLSEDGSGPAVSLISTRQMGTATEEVKIEAKGHYYVKKVLLTGKSIDLQLEKSLNEFAEQGWRLQHIVQTSSEAFAILARTEPDQNEQDAGAES